MRGEHLVGVAKSAEVDDATHTGSARGHAEMLSGHAIALLESSLAPGHRVDEVVRNVHPLHHRQEASRIECVPSADVDPLPAPSRNVRRITREADDLVPDGEEPRNEAAPDVSGSASHEDLHRCLDSA